MLRGKPTVHWRRAVLALVVASCATLAAGRLLYTGDEDPEFARSGDESLPAGHLDAEFPNASLPVSPAPAPISISFNIDRTVRASSYLHDAGLDPQAANEWEIVLEQAGGTSKFIKGHNLTLLKDPVTGDLRGLRYNINDRVAISEEHYGDGVLRASQALIRYTFQPIAVSFRVRSNFWREAGEHDLPRPIIDTLDYAFRDGHSLHALPRGSEVKLIYQEKVSRDGSTRFATGIEAASISFGAHTWNAFAFRDENGQPRLYDENGVALGPQALRFPLNFEFISSGFSPHRYHPILHEYRAHEGVDLVARYGTPVKAVADGRVVQAGWCGELGRCVRIHHDGGIVSIYGHLSQIGQGVEAGRDVRVGEVIGEVGSSGLSTGPHLHYAIEKDGAYVNPLNQTLGVHHRVSPRLRGLFDRFKGDYLAVLDHLRVGEHHEVALPAAVPASGNPVVNATIERQPKRIGARPLRVERTAAVVGIDGRASVMR
jgi:hypothetical protein